MDVEVLGQDDDAGSSDADGVRLVVVAEGDLSGLVDDVAADAVVGVVVSAARGGLGSAGVGGGRGCAVLEGPV